MKLKLLMPIIACSMAFLAYAQRIYIKKMVPDETGTDLPVATIPLKYLQPKH